MKVIKDNVTNNEIPILGAPLMFELIRSFNINGNTEIQLVNSANKAYVAPFEFEPNTNTIVNTTNYNGFYYRTNPATPLKFVRSSIVNSNPYILLTQKDIKANAVGLEQDFTTLRDTAKIKASIDQYWNRLIGYDNYAMTDATNVDTQKKYIGYFPGFHLIYAYMIENSKIFQIFERIISNYQHGEELTIPYNNTQLLTRPWIENTHQLFFSNSQNAVWNENSMLGSNFEAMRRNGYHRLFGLDLNHGIGENGITAVPYKRANHFNVNFIQEFENFLKLCWQMMINFANVNSVNTTDLIALQEQANSIRNLLLARRTTDNSLDNYTLLNLSKLEYHSVIMAEWFKHAISYNSPIVVELGAEGVTASERLNRLGQRVGIPCHSKAGNFLDLAPLMATLLRLLELNEVDNDYITAIANLTTRAYTLIASILYNYQLATGKDLKNQVMLTNKNIMVNKMATI